MPEAFENWINEYVFTVDHFLTEAACDRYIRISEELGYEVSTVTSPSGHIIRKDLRNNDRVLHQDDELAAELWERAEAYIPREYEARTAVGLNELFRFYRYDPGQHFNWHIDHPFERENGEKSFWTFLIYLNDDFEGGGTAFEDSYSDESFDEITVKPKKGTALFFYHHTHHTGEVVTEGRKYVLRTDVMYSQPDFDKLEEYHPIMDPNEDDWD